MSKSISRRGPVRRSRRNRAKYWERLVRAWEQSGLSQAEFCRRRKIKPVAFGWWKRKLKGAANKGGHHVGHGTAKPRARRGADFVELALPDNRSAISPTTASRLTSSAVLRPRWTLPAAVGAIAHHYEIALSSGRVIRLTQDFDPTVVSQLIIVAESC